jgi:hypothetical protein
MSASQCERLKEPKIAYMRKGKSGYSSRKLKIAFYPRTVGAGVAKKRIGACGVG